MSKDKRATSVRVLASLIIFVMLMFVLIRTPFPSSEYSHTELIPTKPSGEIGGVMSRFLWDFRGFDLMYQTLILFTTAVCCLALLREENK